MKVRPRPSWAIAKWSRLPTGYHETVMSFANNIHTHEGGTHEQGFRTALTRV
ncbi:hypothetical protein GR255_27035, partial [Mycobacterium tuberculosis]|nr:hypothetical protein [Mycobacterium tuberculosis]